MIIKNNQMLILGFFGNSLSVSLTAATFRKSLLTGLLVLLLSACSGDSSDLVKYINEVKSRPGRPIEPIPKFAPLPIFRFPENDNRRNPFKPIDQKKRNDIYAPDKKRPKQPLESFPLDALKFVGTLKKDNEIWALIKQPDGQISRVRVGDYMGQNYGRIILIKNDLIKLEETVQKSGTWEKQSTTINLDTGKQE
ncbi:TPA: pilus assembly protein PilP [Legionella pneumophila]|uniref:pilus assembly protein PilP n=1 Tax=Legionella pneumophila TaxID=446 RepID=UPI001375238B|nr:pilus assembly protein PilP [Legionella pneumophila]HAT9116878.1 pilus assembly protein PilP [Legionella pneumophila subsp. pneumophila]MDW8899298.1 pilus assembly protein PilP [Legionella pneumophila]MDW8906325.1 pilus assembly protein PilP [Legionella pneumophila]HAT1792750.1 pilus assembly protein PilP [Legionella pneumophila]HAT1873363.1 pilus assembly protein PilP [Legionella pneumophila]